jgi:peroxiredoxin Q/BCP
MPAKKAPKATTKKPTVKAKAKTPAKKVTAKKPVKAAPKKAAPKKAAAPKAAAKKSGLTVGSKAPTFSLPTDSGMMALGALKGQNVVLYFYPKDDTPGCTVEACTFSSHLPKFDKMNAVIIGISRDSVASHQKFKKKFNLKFTLAADEKEAVCKAYGVLKEKNMYGKKVMGIERSTFLIDATGIIRAIWRSVQVEGHSAEVQTALQAMKGSKATAKKAA